MTNRQKQAVKTRNHIKACTTRLIKEQGYDAVTIKDICEAASVSVGTFYHYFENKEDVINDGYKTFDLFMEEHYSALPDGAKNPLDAVLILMKAHLQYTSDDGANIIVPIFQMQLSNQEKYIINRDRFFNNKLEELVALCLGDGSIVSRQSACEISDRLIRLNRGVIYDWCLHNGEYDLVQTGFYDLRLMLRGLQEA